MSVELQTTLNKFVFLAIELSALFIGISLLVGVLQRHIPPKKIESLLSGHRSTSYLLAAGLGSITPFCSCSTIPMLKGLIRARAGFGPMMVFLFTSPLLNPVVVVLLVATFGPMLTGIYVMAALLVSLGAGWLLQTLGFDRYIRPEAQTQSSQCGAASPVCSPTLVDSTPREAHAAVMADTSKNAALALPVLARSSTTATPLVSTSTRYHGLWNETWGDFIQLSPYLFLGVLTGSVIYGFMPIGLLEQYAGPNNPLAIPVAAVVGIPLYIRAEAVIPLAAGLLGKGAGAGTVLALIIGSAGASLTELILLRALFSARLLAVFIMLVLGMAIIAGYVTYLVY